MPAHWACCAWSTQPVPPIWRAMASRDRWKISSVRNIGQFIFRRCWAQDPWMGISGRRQLRDASVARRPTRQQRADLRSRRPRRPWPDSSATLGDWPILREWSACGDPTRFSSPGARRVPRRGTSEQSVAPRPCIHEMDRRCAGAVSGIARRTSSSGPRNQHSEVVFAGRRSPVAVGGRRPGGLAASPLGRGDGRRIGHPPTSRIASGIARSATVGRANVDHGRLGKAGKGHRK